MSNHITPTGISLAREGFKKEQEEFSKNTNKTRMQDSKQETDDVWHRQEYVTEGRVSTWFSLRAKNDSNQVMNT